MQIGFVLLASIWEYDFPPFMVLIIAILNDGDDHFSLNFTASKAGIDTRFIQYLMVGHLL
jgi:hypothetical protein